MENISRRSFLAGGAGVAALSMLGFTAPAFAAPTEGGFDPEAIEWDYETDVVVVGFGGAGASAAINASDAGADVIILEKAPEGDEGGNTSVSGGGSHLHYSFEYLRANIPDVVDDEEIEGLIDEYHTLVDWACAHGAPADPENKDSFSIGNGYALFQWLKAVTENCEGVEIMYETPAKRLIFDPATKEVFGVIAEQGGKDINVKARRGVVLGLGGFEANHQMKQTYYAPNVPIYACGTPYNTGDGIPMVAEVGAQMRGFGSIEWGTHCCKVGSDEIGVSLGFNFLDATAYDNAIIVNAKGKRFMNETADSRYPSDFVIRPLHSKEQLPEVALEPVTFMNGDTAEGTIYEYANLPMFLIFGETRKANGKALFSAAGEGAGNHWANIHGAYTWSADNEAEVEKGWIIKADTLEELAEKAGIDAALVETVATYEAAVEAGTDEEWGREYNLTTLGEGPFYACELGLGIINTQGGPARDAEHHVLNYAGEIIPRLYSGGEFGSIFTFNYPGALNVPESMGTRMAGTNAAAETPWDGSEVGPERGIQAVEDYGVDESAAEAQETSNRGQNIASETGDEAATSSTAAADKADAPAEATSDAPDCAPCHGDAHKPGDENPHGY